MTHTRRQFIRIVPTLGAFAVPSVVAQAFGPAVTTMKQPHVVQARDALIHGILDDMERISQGAALPALGDGPACDYCQVRGLCRKDFWAIA